VLHRYHRVTNPAGPIHISEIFFETVPLSFADVIPPGYQLGQVVHNDCLGRDILVWLPPDSLSSVDVERLRSSKTAWWFPTGYEKSPDCVLPPARFPDASEPTSGSESDDDDDDRRASGSDHSDVSNERYRRRRAGMKTPRELVYESEASSSGSPPPKRFEWGPAKVTQPRVRKLAGGYSAYQGELGPAFSASQLALLETLFPSIPEAENERVNYEKWRLEASADLLALFRVSSVFPFLCTDVPLSPS
jgi:hypothetical protein